MSSQGDWTQDAEASGRQGGSTPSSTGASGLQSQVRENLGSDYGQNVEYGQGEYRPPHGYDGQRQMQGQSYGGPTTSVSTSSTPSHAYYDRAPFSRSSMAAYEPTRLPGQASPANVQSRQPSLDQNAPLAMPSYYDSSALHAQQTQGANYASSYPHYPSHQTSVDPTSPAFRLMRSMGGEGGSVGVTQSMDPHLHGQTTSGGPIPTLTPASQQETSMDPGAYYQQYPSAQSSGYGLQQQGYFAGGGQSAGPHTKGYPAMMGRGLQHYSSHQYPSHGYNVPQSAPQYGINPYASYQQQPNAVFYPNPNQRPGWTPSNWRPSSTSSYYSYPSAPTIPAPFMRSSGSGTSSRPKGYSHPSASTLPMRPGTSPKPLASSFSSANNFADGSGPVSTGLPVESLPESETKVPGKGLRPHYHPQQGPRSDFVLWCGNVPANATVEELWSFFSRLPPSEGNGGQEKEGGEEGDPALSPHSGHGVLSVHVISRSSCSFVNYATPQHLQRAVDYFHGLSLRPEDPRCPKLVCRVRKKDDEAQAGVAGQRGRGMHVAWVKEQDRKATIKSRAPRGPGEDRGADSPSDLGFASESMSAKETASLARNQTTVGALSSSASLRSDEAPSSPLRSGIPVKSEQKSGTSPASLDSFSGSVSYTSTNSSLFRHPAFHERFFILKSLGTADLDRSVQSGLWATQPHNEQVLDQAYRNSESVYLIFSANQSGGFYGYARMTGSIAGNREKHAVMETGAGQSSSRPHLSRPDAIPEGDESKVEVAGVGGSTMVGPNQQSSDPTIPSTHFPLSEEGLDLRPTLSPQQLTPAAEIEPSLPRMGITSESQTWPSKTTKEREAAARNERRGHTLSPHTIPPDPMQSTVAKTAAPMLTTMETGQTKPALLQPGPVSSTVTLPAATTVIDEHGVRRKDMASASTLPVGSEGETKSGGMHLSEVESLDPSDSASLSDTRMQSNLSIRAQIHNLRLDERESVLQAERLERGMSEETAGHNAVASNSDGDQTNTSRQSSSNSWGKPFAVEWIKTTPLAFNLVRKLRNPWRDNRQVKVSRDGTELEPNVGRQLLLEWDKVDQSSPSSASKLPATSPSHLGEEEEDDG